MVPSFFKKRKKFFYRLAVVGMAGGSLGNKVNKKFVESMVKATHFSEKVRRRRFHQYIYHNDADNHHRHRRHHHCYHHENGDN